MGPISLDNIDIMQDWIVVEENLLDKNDFDMNWKVIKEPLIIFSKIINDEEIIFMKITKPLFYQMKFNGNELVFSGNLEMLIVIINNFVLVCVYLIIACI